MGAPICDHPWGELEAGMGGVLSTHEAPACNHKPPALWPGQWVLCSAPGWEEGGPWWGKRGCVCPRAERTYVGCACCSGSLSLNGQAMRLPREPALLF